MALLSKEDMTELKRLSTNMYDRDKEHMNRIIRAISVADTHFMALKAENQKLKEELAAARAQLEGAAE